VPRSEKESLYDITMSATRWVLITGEYPPAPGGVSDYTCMVAHGLAEAGDEVHVWAPGPPSLSYVGIWEPDAVSVNGASDSVSVHRLQGAFGSRDLEVLDGWLSQMAKPYRLLVQYVPHAFGCKGMNLPFCWWLSRRPEPVWIMFHEVVFPIARAQPLTHNFLGVVTRLMVSLVARKAERIFVTVPAWEALLPNTPNVRRRVRQLAVPSNIPTAISSQAVREIRRQIASANEVVVGHFGTYGPAVTGLLTDVLPALLQKDSNRRVLLVGQGSDRFGKVLREANPDLQRQIQATGIMAPEKIAAHLAACDCLVQPFIDGVSSRRTSLMAGLALGLPIVTNAGPLTDPIWKNTDALELASSPSHTSLLDAVENLLAEPKRLSELRRRAAGFYQRNFSLARIIEILRSETAVRRIAS